MKVELNSHLVSRIKNLKNNGSSEFAIDLLKEVADAIDNVRIEYEEHIENLIDSIN